MENEARKRVVITGVGILVGNGKGRREFWDSLKEGKVGYAPVTLFDPAEFKVNIGAEVKDFDAKVYMGQKGLRLLDRSTRLIISAAKLAIDDSKLVITDENTDDVGVSVGTTLGSLKSIAEFDEVTLREGPRYVNPALFPNTVINSPASQISIWHHIEGFNTTISTGFTAAIDAMSYAWDFIQWDRAKVVLAGTVEEMCYHTFYGFHVLGFMSGSKDEHTYFANCPFDKRRNGVTFGEGACILVMEELEHAKARNANILAEVLGFGYEFDPWKIHRYNPRGPGIRGAMRKALEDANCKPEDIDCIYANANSTQVADRVETEAIKDVFGEHAKKVPVTALKSMVGECYSATGLFMAAAAIGSINEDFIPPTVNLQESDPECDLDYVPNQARQVKVNKVLVNTFGPNGSNSCVVVGRYVE